MKYVVVTGNPADGFDIFGPFDDEESAAKYIDDVGEADMWCLVLKSPDDEDLDDAA